MTARGFARVWKTVVRQRLMACVAMLVVSEACQTSQMPVDPVWGKQPCAHCHMLLSDPRTAAQILSADREPLYFDDVGCMLAFLEREKLPVAGSWVRDSNAKWLPAASARYVANQHTPMGFGYVVGARGPVDFAHLRDAIAAQAAAGRAP